MGRWFALLALVVMVVVMAAEHGESDAAFEMASWHDSKAVAGDAPLQDPDASSATGLPGQLEAPDNDDQLGVSNVEEQKRACETSERAFRDLLLKEAAVPDSVGRCTLNVKPCSTLRNSKQRAKSWRIYHAANAQGPAGGHQSFPKMTRRAVTLMIWARAAVQTSQPCDNSAWLALWRGRRRTVSSATSLWMPLSYGCKMLN